MYLFLFPCYRWLVSQDALVRVEAEDRAHRGNYLKFLFCTTSAEQDSAILDSLLKHANGGSVFIL